MRINYKVRKAVANDAAVLAQLRWEFRAESGEIPAVTWASFEQIYAEYCLAGISAGSRVHFLADADGTIVGNCTVQIVEMVPRPCRVHDGWGYLTDTFVRMSHRKHGIGRALIEAAIEWARNRDLELLITWPSDESIELYERVGFKADTEPLQLTLREF